MYVSYNGWIYWRPRGGSGRSLALNSFHDTWRSQKMLMSTYISVSFENVSYAIRTHYLLLELSCALMEPHLIRSNQMNNFNCFKSITSNRICQTKRIQEEYVNSALGYPMQKNLTNASIPRVE